MANAYSYAGFRYLSYPYQQSPPGFGVSASIYTINPSVSGLNHIAQYVTVIVSASPLYWVQTGYAKGVGTSYILKSYTELCDQNHPQGSTQKIYYTSPTAGTTYSWLLYRDTPSSTVWKASSSLWGSTTHTIGQPVPSYTQLNYQSESEVLQSGISMANSHFYSLSYHNSQTDWTLWPDPYPQQIDQTSPYWCTKIHSYEFTAGGP